MKKVYLLFFLFFVSSSVFAQTIGYRDENENILVVASNYMLSKPFGSYATGVSLAVITNKTSGEKAFNLGILFETYGKTYCQEGSKAIFKTFAGSIVTVHEFLDTNDVENKREKVSDYNIFRLKPHYEIGEEDLQKLMTEGIQLLRIETLSGLKNYTYKKDVLGEYLKAEYDLVLEKRDFGSDF